MIDFPRKPRPDYVPVVLSPLSTLLLIFVVLKLTGVIDWSWWWVVAPLWLPMTVAMVICAICFVVFYLVQNLDPHD